MFQELARASDGSDLSSTESIDKVTKASKKTPRKDVNSKISNMKMSPNEYKKYEKSLKAGEVPKVRKVNTSSNPDAYRKAALNEALASCSSKEALKTNKRDKKNQSEFEIEEPENYKKNPSTESKRQELATSAWGSTPSKNERQSGKDVSVMKTKGKKKLSVSVGKRENVKRSKDESTYGKEEVPGFYKPKMHKDVATSSRKEKDVPGFKKPKSEASKASRVSEGRKGDVGSSKTGCDFKQKESKKTTARVSIKPDVSQKSDEKLTSTTPAVVQSKVVSSTEKIVTPSTVGTKQKQTIKTAPSNTYPMSHTASKSLRGDQDIPKKAPETKSLTLEEGSKNIPVANIDASEKDQNEPKVKKSSTHTVESKSGELEASSVSSKQARFQRLKSDKSDDYAATQPNNNTLQQSEKSDQSSSSTLGKTKESSASLKDELTPSKYASTSKSSKETSNAVRETRYVAPLHHSKSKDYHQQENVSNIGNEPKTMTDIILPQAVSTAPVVVHSVKETSTSREVGVSKAPKSHSERLNSSRPSSGIANEKEEHSSAFSKHKEGTSPSRGSSNSNGRRGIVYNPSMNQEVVHLRDRNIILEDQNQDLIEKIKTLYKQNALLRGNVQALGNELSTLRKQINYHEGLCSDLRSHIFEMEANLAIKFKATLDRPVATAQGERVRVLEALQQQRQGLDHIISILDNEIDVYHADSTAMMNALDKMRQKMLVDMSNLSRDMSRVSNFSDIELKGEDNKSLDVNNLMQNSEKGPVENVKSQESFSSSNRSSPEFSSVHEVIDKLQEEIQQLSQSVVNLSGPKGLDKFEERTIESYHAFVPIDSSGKANNATESESLSKTLPPKRVGESDYEQLKKQYGIVCQLNEEQAVQLADNKIQLEEEVAKTITIQTALFKLREESAKVASSQEHDLEHLKKQNEIISTLNEEQAQELAQARMQLEEEIAKSVATQAVLCKLREEHAQTSNAQEKAVDAVSSMQQQMSNAKSAVEDREDLIYQMGHEIEELSYTLAESEIIEDTLCGVIKEIEHSRGEQEEQLSHALSLLGPAEESKQSIQYAELDAYEMVCMSGINEENNENVQADKYPELEAYDASTDADIKHEIEKLHQELFSLQKSNTITEVANVALESELKGVVSQLELEKLRNDDIFSTMEEYNNCTIVNLNMQVELLEREVQVSQARIEELSTYNAQIEAQVNDLKEENKNFISENSALLQVSDIIVSDRNALKEKIPELQENVDNLSQEKENLAKANEELGKEIKEKENLLAEKVAALMVLQQVSTGAINYNSPEDKQQVDQALNWDHNPLTRA